MGETSGAACRLAGFGLPILVSDVGWFSELPSSFASKIPIGEGEVEILAAEIERLCFTPGEAETRAAAARAWGEERHPDLTARAYLKVLEDAASGEASQMLPAWHLPSASHRHTPPQSAPSTRDDVTAASCGPAGGGTRPFIDSEKTIDSLSTVVIVFFTIEQV